MLLSEMLSKVMTLPCWQSKDLPDLILKSPIFTGKYANVTKCKVVVTFYNSYLINYIYLCNRN